MLNNLRIIVKVKTIFYTHCANIAMVLQEDPGAVHREGGKFAAVDKLRPPAPAGL